jgi:transcriptional regulator with XRE-family HTH domain
MEHKIHEGRNVKRFREMLGIKQEALAAELGEEWTQKKISLLETKETVDTGVLQRIAEAFKIPVDAFKNFDEEMAVNIISNTFADDSVAYAQQYKCVVNPLDVILKLHEEKIALYERMIKAKDELIEKMEKLLDKNQ